MSAASDPVAESIASIDTRGLKAYRGDPSRLKPDELVEQTFRSEFPNGFELLAREDEKVVIFKSLATLLGPFSPCEYTNVFFQAETDIIAIVTSQKHFNTSWWEEILNLDQLAVAILSDSDENRTFVRQCQYVLGCAAEKLGHSIMLGVCYDNGTKSLVGQPRLRTHIPWVHIKLPADPNSRYVIWSRMKPKSSKTIM